MKVAVFFFGMLFAYTLFYAGLSKLGTSLTVSETGASGTGTSTAPNASGPQPTVPTIVGPVPVLTPGSIGNFISGIISGLTGGALLWLPASPGGTQATGPQGRCRFSELSVCRGR